MKTWRKMEELVETGLVRHIGTSNMTIPKLKLVLRDARIKPAVNEMELASAFSAAGAVSVCCRATALQPVGYCPMGRRAGRIAIARRKTRLPTEDPVIVEIAQRHGIHPAVVCIKWAVQRGQTPIPFSTNRSIISPICGAW